MIELEDTGGCWKATNTGEGEILQMEAGGRTNQYFAGDYSAKWTKSYQSFEALPTKAKEAVAVLSMNVDGEFTPGVGLRISSTRFWLEDPLVAEAVELDREVQKER